MDVSVIITARNEVYLQRTIDSVLAAAEAKTEVIAICDGYWPDPPIQDDPRVVLIHHTESIGQRGAINEGAKIAKGKYVMKLDAHCNVDKGFDVKLMADCEYDWTVIPRMYNLNYETWEPKLIEDPVKAVRKGKLHDYMYIGWNGKGEMRTLYYTGTENKKWHQRTELIDDTMSCMGCCFFMHKDRFWELGGCDEGHGGWGQQGVEVSLKAWLSGGSLKVNKKTWFAHWFRASDGGFPYPASGNAHARARHYSRDLWLNDKWPLQKREFDWVIEKFNPPTWENKMDKKFARHYFNHMIKKDNIPKWLGVDVVKYPGDLMLYQEVLFENKPDFLVETGTYMGGSALFFANMFDLIGKGEVISIDLSDRKPPQHPRITYITGRSTAVDTLEKVRTMVGDKSVMVCLLYTSPSPRDRS